MERLPGTLGQLTVVCAGTPWNGIWFPEKHIADRLTAYGPVLWVDLRSRSSRRGVTRTAADSMQGPRLRPIRPGLARLTPIVLPAMRRPGMERVTEVLVRRALRSAFAALGGTVRAVVIACPTCSSAGAASSCGSGTPLTTSSPAPPSWGWAWHRSDATRAPGRTGRPRGRSLRSRWSIIGAHWGEALSCRQRLRRLDVRHHRPGAAADDVDLPGPIAGFIGHLSDRIASPCSRPWRATGRSLLLVGPRQPTFEMGRIGAAAAGPAQRPLGGPQALRGPPVLHAGDRRGPHAYAAASSTRPASR